MRAASTLRYTLTLGLYRTLRREPLLTQFETAQIANLVPADVDEAKSIVPRCDRVGLRYNSLD